MRARLKKKAGGRGAPPRGELGGAEPPHLQMVEILVGMLIHSFKGASEGGFKGGFRRV